MRTLFTLLAALTTMGLVGCQLQQPQPQQQLGQYGSSSVLDVRPVRSAAPRFSSPSVVAPPDEPVVATVDPAQRWAPETTVTPNFNSPRSDAYASDAITSRAQKASYKVKKGDTLYRIAKVEYGDGKKWKLIVSANPGVSPQTLKAGQTLRIP